MLSYLISFLMQCINIRPWFCLCNTTDLLNLEQFLQYSSVSTSILFCWINKCNTKYLEENADTVLYLTIPRGYRLKESFNENILSDLHLYIPNNTR